MIDSSLYDDPELYDLLFGAEPAVVSFYVEQARRARGPILELACGSGEILVPVAKACAEVVGLDASPTMLARAQQKAAAAAVSVQLIEGDMRTFELKREFGLVLVASNSILHLHELASLQQFFEAVRRHLAPRGLLIFDVANPSVHALSRAPTEHRQLGTIDHSQWGTLSLEESSEYDAAEQVTRSRWYLRSAQHRNLGKFSVRLRNIFPRELELLIESCGFALTQRLGDFDGSAFSATSPHQVCVCEVANRVTSMPVDASAR
jgi:SAM-dependent methyltransferase